MTELTRRNKELNYRLDTSKVSYGRAQDEIDQLNGEIDDLKRRVHLQEKENNLVLDDARQARDHLKKESGLLLSLINFLERSEGKSNNFKTPLRTIEERVKAIIL